MQIVKVSYIHLKNKPLRDGIILSDMKDVVSFVKFADGKVQQAMTKLIKSGVTPDRYDHIVGSLGFIEKAVATTAVVKAGLENRNPLYEMGNARDMFVNGLIHMVSSRGAVFINENGGYSPVDELIIHETKEIGSSDEIPVPVRYKIGEKTKVINFENDITIESAADVYMRVKFQGKYSYIKEMRLLTKWQWEDVLKQFKDAGGDTVYVYTTGRDVEQMYEYSNHALDAGLKKFIFHFNEGTSPGITTFLEWLNVRAVVEHEFVTE